MAIMREFVDPGIVSIPEDANGSPALRGARCKHCGQHVFPAMPVCPSCLTDGAMEDVEIGRTGCLYSHTIAWFAPAGFKAPYYQAFVDLDEGPRVFTLISSECPVETGFLQDGMSMRLVIEPISELEREKAKWTFKYVPQNFKTCAEGGKYA